MERRTFVKTALVGAAGLALTPALSFGAKPIARLKSYSIFDILDMEGWKYKKKINGIGPMYEIWHPDRCLTGRVWCWSHVTNNHPMALYIDEQILGGRGHMFHDTDYRLSITQLYKALRGARQAEGWDGLPECMRNKGYQLDGYDSHTRKTVLHFSSPTQGKVQITYHNDPIKPPGGLSFQTHWTYTRKALNGFTYQGWAQSAGTVMTWVT